MPGGFVNLLQPSPLVASLDRTAGRGAGDGLRGLREGLTPAADLRGVTVPDRPSLRRAHRESGPEPVVHAGRPPELGRRALPEPAGRGRETTGCSRRGAGREASLQCSAWAGRGGLTEGGCCICWPARVPGGFVKTSSPWFSISLDRRTAGRGARAPPVTGVDLLLGASGEDGLSSTCTRTRGQNGFIILRQPQPRRLPGTGSSRL